MKQLLLVLGICVTLVAHDKPIQLYSSLPGRIIAHNNLHPSTPRNLTDSSSPNQATACPPTVSAIATGDGWKPLGAGGAGTALHRNFHVAGDTENIVHANTPSSGLGRAQWTIMICTLDERAHLCTELVTKLLKQISDLGLQQQVEVLCCKDNRDYSVGYKRNLLLKEAAGEYVCFVDDDDDVHDQYVSMIVERLRKKPDCVSLVGIILTNGTDPHYFIHSARYSHYFTHEGVYYRPPNHLNPMKRAIAIQVPFPDKIYGEDYDWTMRVNALGLFKYEEEIMVPYYLYRYDGKYDRPSASKV